MSETVETVVSTTQVAHVTFSITKTGTWEFQVYSSTRRDGKRLIGETFDQHLAQCIMDEEVKKLEAILERKRQGEPTPSQLMFLFRKTIPIPPTLTWGEASDLIGECIALDQQAREAARREKAAAKQRAFDPPYQPGEKVSHPAFGNGIVLHAGNTLAGVQFRDERKTVNVEELTPGA